MIRFISSDRCRTLHQWLKNLTDNSGHAASPILIDATGDYLDLKTAQAEYEWIQFDHNKVLQNIWSELKPHAKDWWDLLDISDKQSAELPSLLGLEDITRLLFLSQQFQALDDQAEVIVILPPPHHAIQLLGMAQQGPVLIENLLEPLLNWWDQTRKSLSAVETILRIKLPSSQQLRFSQKWRDNLEQLEAITSDRKRHRFHLILDGDNQTQQSLLRRLSICGLNGVIPSDLIISDVSSDLMQRIGTQLDQEMMHFRLLDQFNQCSLPNSDPDHDNVKADLQLNESEHSVSVFLPGVAKNDLTIQQINGCLYLFHLGQKRVLELPDFLQGMTCQRGQLDLGWLTLRFIPPEEHA